MIAPALIGALCLPPADMARRLTERYGEARLASGIASAGHVVETWARPDGRSWTLLLILPGGAACIMDSGGALEVSRPGAPV